MKSTVVTVAPDRLKLHHLQQAIFPNRKPNAELISSVKENGFIHRAVTARGFIISGTRRVGAALSLGMKTIEVDDLDIDPDSLEARKLWIDANAAHLDLTAEQRIRLYAERKKVEAELAKQRKLSGTGETKTEVADHGSTLTHGNGRTVTATILGGKLGNTDHGSTLTHGNGRTVTATISGGKLGSTDHGSTLTHGSVCSGSAASLGDKKRGNRAADIAAESVNLSRNTAEKGLKAVKAIDAAKSAGDTKKAEAIGAALESSLQAGHRAAMQHGGGSDHQEPTEDPVAKSLKKAQAALTAYLKFIEPAQMAAACQSLLMKCGGYVTDEHVAVDAKPTTPEEFIAYVRDGMSDLKKKDIPKACTEAARELLDGADVNKLLPDVLKAVQTAEMKPTAYLGALPDAHVEAVEKVSAEWKVRIQQLKGFEVWQPNGRPKAVRDFCKTARRLVKAFEDHCAVGSEEQPTLIDTEFPEKLDTPELRAIWAEWWKHRKDNKRPVTDLVKRKQLKLLSQGDTDQAMEILTKGLESGKWAGIPNDIWKSPWAGRMLGKSAGSDSRAMSDAELFLTVIDAVKKTWSPDSRNVDDVKAVLNDDAIYAAVHKLGFNAIAASSHNDAAQRSRFMRVLEEFRGGK